MTYHRMGAAAWLLLICSSCVTMTSPQVSYVQMCNEGRVGACQLAGETLSGDSVLNLMDTGDDPVVVKDRDLARLAFDWDCRHGNGVACHKLVTLKLVEDPQEIDRYLAIATYGGVPLPTEAQLAAERARKQVAADEFNQWYRAETARREEESRRNWAETMQQAGELLGNYAKNLDSAYRSSGAAASGGPGGDPCLPCAPTGSAMTSACRSPQSPDCYSKAAAMHRCTADAPGCSQNPQWSRDEANRMDRAAAEIAR